MRNPVACLEDKDYRKCYILLKRIYNNVPVMEGIPNVRGIRKTLDDALRDIRFLAWVEREIILE